MSLSTSSVASAWRALSWKHLVLTFLFCLAWSALEVGLQSSGFSKFRWSRWGPSVNSLLSLLLNGFVVMLAVLIADQASPPSLRRWWPYVLAVVLGVAIATSLFWLVSQRLFTIPSALQLAGIPEGFDTIAFRHGTSRLVICALATYVYVSHRFAAQRLAALRIVQIERATAERRVLESRLSAMQARVEPQFLVETLAQVERLYDVDAPAADRVLRELTAYLRAAIPRTGDSRSTVATEIRLANTFLNIAAVRSRDRLVLNGGESSGPQDARFPPMVLLPLVKHALTHRVGRAQDDEWFGINVAVRDEKLVMTIHDRRGGFAPEDESDAEIEQIRDLLAALYGDRGRLTLRESEETTAAVLEIPYERIADPVVV